MSILILLLTFSSVFAKEAFYKSKLSLSHSVQHTVIDFKYQNEHSFRYKRAAGDIPDNTTSTATPNAPVASEVGAEVNSTTGAPATTPTTTPTTPELTTIDPDATTLNSVELNDLHTYYSSRVYQNEADKHWDDKLDGHTHRNLSDSHRVAVTLNLSFKFRFYGHNITNITVATGGFIYMSPFVHSWLTATQYVAPLMANFHTSNSNESDIKFRDYGDRFVVHWKDVQLKDQPASQLFNFQTILYDTGLIKFIYKRVPISTHEILTDNHPVKIGLSDAFYIDTVVPRMDILGGSYGGYTRRTIYEYHRINLLEKTIQNGSVVILTPLRTCNLAENCEQCTSQSIDFDCSWCNNVQRCSDGFDWHRQQWFNAGCQEDGHSLTNNCRSGPPTMAPQTPVPTTKVPTTQVPTTQVPTTLVPNTGSPLRKTKCTVKKGHLSTNCTSAEDKGDDAVIAIIVVVVLLIVALIVGIVGWLYYSYTHPTSTSGMWLMEHRPSQMKDKIAKIQFWKSSTPSGDKYKVESSA